MVEYGKGKRFGIFPQKGKSQVWFKVGSDNHNVDIIEPDEIKLKDGGAWMNECHTEHSNVASPATLL